MDRPIWQKALLGALLIGAVIWASYTYLLKDKMKELSELKGSTESIEKQIQVLGPKDISMDSGSIMKEINKKLSEISAKVPSEADIPYLLERFIADSLKGIEIDYTLIQPMAPVQEETFKRIPINVDMVASFEPFNLYLRRLETFPIVIRIDQMDISKSNENKQSLNIKLSLSAFVMPGAPSSTTEAPANMSQIPNIDPFFETVFKMPSKNEAKRVSDKTRTRTAITNLPKFKGIYKGATIKAFINDEFCAVGDSIDGFTVTKISGKYVIVTKNKISYTLKLGR